MKKECVIYGLVTIVSGNTVYFVDICAGAGFELNANELENKALEAYVVSSDTIPTIVKLTGYFTEHYEKPWDHMFTPTKIEIGTTTYTEIPFTPPN